MKLFSRVKLECCAVSHVGRVRGNNEDNFILTDRWNETSGDYKMDARRMAVSRGKWLVLGVFDGMGGGEMGEAASRAASMRFLALQRMLKRCPPERLGSLVRRAFQDANNDIVALQEQAAVFGTTATVLCTNGEAFRIWHQGDSRAYLLRGGILRQLTEDQTLAQMKIRVGLCRADDPKLEPDRHKLTDYVGKDWTKENLRPAESDWLQLQWGDRLLLCSDGLYDMVPEAVIAARLADSSTAEAAVSALVEAALRGGGGDNVTCLTAFWD